VKSFSLPIRHPNGLPVECVFLATPAVERIDLKCKQLAAKSLAKCCRVSSREEAKFGVESAIFCCNTENLAGAEGVQCG
jgi:hypothetical protein